MRLVLYHPEIPPNTGNVARLCAAMDVPLHLIEPLGFSLDDKHLKRAGLDYWPYADVRVHRNWTDFASAYPEARIVLTSARRGAALSRFVFRPEDAIVLGPESTGLPKPLFERYAEWTRIPITCAHVRSLNLSTSAGIILYEALRQTGGLAEP